MIALTGTCKLRKASGRLFGIGLKISPIAQERDIWLWLIARIKHH
jgi:hypothetical protein